MTNANQIGEVGENMPLYKLKIRKSWGGRNAANSWVNTYDIESDVPLDDAQWINTVEKFASMERAIHLSSTHFLSALVSTYNQEPTYEWKNLRSFALQGVGGVNEETLRTGYPAGVTTIAADLNFALQVNKVVTLGRAGKMFYRGVLVWPDIVVGSNGKPTLTAAALSRVGGTALTNAFTQLATVFPNFQWVMAPDPAKVAAENPDQEPDEPGSQVTIDVRNVLGVQATGVILNKRDHRWFDKVPRGGGSQDAGA